MGNMLLQQSRNFNNSPKQEEMTVKRALRLRSGRRTL